MLTNSDRKLLTLACGKYWHDYKLSKLGNGLSRCSCGLTGSAVLDICTKANRTFASADDWELVREKVVVPNLEAFSDYLWQKWLNIGPNGSSCLMWFLTLSIEERCQLVCDFIKANPHLFPAVMQYLASLVITQPSSTQIVSGKKMPWEKMPWEKMK